MEMNYLQTLIKHSPLNEINTKHKWDEITSQLLEEQEKFLMNNKYHFYGQFVVPNLVIHDSPIAEWISLSFNALIDIENHLVSCNAKELLEFMKNFFINSINLISATFTRNQTSFEDMSIDIHDSLPTNMKEVCEYIYSVTNIPTEELEFKRFFNNLLIKLKIFLEESYDLLIGSLGLGNPNYVNALEIQIHYSLFVMKIISLSDEMMM